MSIRPRLWQLGLLTIAALLLLAGLFRAGRWRPYEPDEARFPIWGVDVSHHQGEIDWVRLRSEDRIAFAYVKATEGGDWVDPRFAQNWREASAAGLRVGAYHFFTFCRPPEEQLANFLRVVPSDRDALPPAVDVEFGGNCRSSATVEKVREDLDAFLGGLERATGRAPILYVTQEAWDAFFAEDPTPHRVWLRSIYRQPKDDRWALWQFDPRGRLPGVETWIDLNAFRGTIEQLHRL